MDDNEKQSRLIQNSFYFGACERSIPVTLFQAIKPANCWVKWQTAAPVTNFIIFGNNKYTFASLTNKYNNTSRKHKDMHVSADVLARTLHRNRQKNKKRSTYSPLQGSECILELHMMQYANKHPIWWYFWMAAEKIK